MTDYKRKRGVTAVICKICFIHFFKRNDSMNTWSGCCSGCYRSTDLYKNNMSASQKKRDWSFRKGYPSPMKDKKWSDNSDRRLKASISFLNRFKDDITKHPRWIPDRTKLKKSENKMHDVQYIYWAKQVKNRDHWKCRLLNSDCNGRLEAHHILNWIDHPELRYQINNGITLCHAHHPRGRENEAKLSPYLMTLVSEMK